MLYEDLEPNKFENPYEDQIDDIPLLDILNVKHEEFENGLELTLQTAKTPEEIVRCVVHRVLTCEGLDAEKLTPIVSETVFANTEQLNAMLLMAHKIMSKNMH